MECYLAQGELIRVDGGKEGVTLRCTSGTVWLTNGNGVDYLLHAGKSFVVAANQVAVAEAIKSAECTLLKLLSKNSQIISNYSRVHHATRLAPSAAVSPDQLAAHPYHRQSLA